MRKKVLIGIIAALILPINVSANNYCNCKEFVSRYIQPPNRGNAHTWKTNSIEPIFGGVVVWHKGSGVSKFGHVGIVLDYDENYIHVLDANYKRCKLTYRRVKRNERGIKGYYDPNVGFPIVNMINVAQIYYDYEQTINSTKK